MEVQLLDAIADLPALVEAAQRGETTTILRDGKPAAMLVPVMLEGEVQADDADDFLAHLMSIPEAIDVERDQTPPREFEL